MLANGNKFQQVGKIGAIEANFNNETGNIPFRADFPNPDRLLRHGQTGTVLIQPGAEGRHRHPPAGDLRVLDKRYVYVVDKDDVVHQREIVVQNELDDIFVIKKGLDVDDKIVLEGIRQVRDGEKVEYEFRQPEQVMRQPEEPGGISRLAGTGPAIPARTQRESLRTMFAKFLHRPALAIVISVHHPVPGRAGDQDPADLPVPLRRAAERGGHGRLSRRQRQRPGRLGAGHPGAGHQRRARTCATWPPPPPAPARRRSMIIFEPGTDPNVAVLNVKTGSTP